MTFLNEIEQDIYFNSDWYKNQIKNKRHELIKKGIIIATGWHKNNPKRVIKI